MDRIPLEDNVEDIVGKVLRGRKLDPAEVARQAGVELPKLKALLAGEFDEATARAVAPVLGLGADALVALGQRTWYPQDPGEIDGLACFNTPYGDMFVNAFLVWDPATKVAAIQRSRGYSWRPSIPMDELEAVIKAIKAAKPEIIVFVDNCYGEFTETTEPLERGADLIAGSLIKNPGAGIVPMGGYVASLALRAAGCEAGERRPTSFSCHYFGVAAFAPVEITVETRLRTAPNRNSATQAGIAPTPTRRSRL